MKNPAKPRQEKSEGQHQTKPASPSPIKINWIQIGLFGLLLLYIFFNNATSVREISRQEFEKSVLRKHAVEKIEVINNEVANVYIKQTLANSPQFKEVFQPEVWLKRTNHGPHYQFTIGSVDAFERKMEQAQKEFTEEQKVAIFYERRSNWLANILL